MTEKEFRKLRAKDLVQLLLKQGGEASQLQEQIDKKEQELVVLLQDNDLLKVKLDERDEYIENLKKDLDFRDSHIRNLETEMEALRNDLWIDMQEIGALTDAVKQVDKIFEAAQREADQHIRFAREQGIDPGKVRIAKPATPMTAMPTSVPRETVVPVSETQRTAAAVPARKAKTAAEAKAHKASAISRFAAESKSAFESNQEVSALDRLTSAAQAKAKAKPEVHAEAEVQIEAASESPERLVKAAQAAAAAIGEAKSKSSAAVGTSDTEASEIVPGVILTPAAETEIGASNIEVPQNAPKTVIASASEAASGASDNIEVTEMDSEADIMSVSEVSQSVQTAQSTQTEAASDAAEPETGSKKSKRRGILGVFRSGKQKFKQGADSYESSPMVARMKN